MSAVVVGKALKVILPLSYRCISRWRLHDECTPYGRRNVREFLDPSLEKDILSSGQETLIALEQNSPAARAKFINIVNQPRD